MASPTAAAQAATASPPIDDDDNDNPHDKRIDELVNATVRVRLIAESNDTPSALSTLPFLLRICANTRLSHAFFQLHVRGVHVQKGVAKKSFYLLVPPERIETLALVDTQHSTLTGDVYRLALVLMDPLDLVGPPNYGCEAGWPGGKDTTKALVALAQASRFELLLPTSTTSRTKLVEFCAAASRTEGLKSLARLYNTTRLYAGAGGYTFSGPETPVLPAPEQGSGESPALPSDQPAASPESDAFMVPVDMPPRYCDGPPGYLEGEGAVTHGKAPCKREKSQEASPRPPAKRRDCDNKRYPDYNTTTASPSGRLSNEFHRSLQRESALADMVRVLAEQNEAQSEAIAQLRTELDELKKKHADLEDLVGSADERLGIAERTVDSLDLRAHALEEDCDHLHAYKVDLEREVEGAVHDALAGMFESGVTPPPMLDEALGEHVEDAVEKKFAQLQGRLRQALDPE